MRRTTNELVVTSEWVAAGGFQARFQLRVGRTADDLYNAVGIFCNAGDTGIELHALDPASALNLTHCAFRPGQLAPGRNTVLIADEFVRIGEIARFELIASTLGGPRYLIEWDGGVVRTRPAAYDSGQATLIGNIEPRSMRE